MSEQLVRKMQDHDIQQVISLWLECGLPYKPEGRDSPDNIRKGMELSNDLFLVAEMDERIVGSLLVTHDGRKGWMNRLGVLPDLRHQGVARALIEEGERWLSEQGIGIFACIVEGHNKDSMEAMKKLGYVEFEGAKYFTKRVSNDI